MKTVEERVPIVPNILIVDDVPDNLKVLGNILKPDGYRIRSVLNGEIALQVTEKEKPDLILLDIMMPEMDGFEVCSRLKKNPSLNDVPIIFISSLNDTDDIVKALTSGGADYITKPFKPEEVKARVATHLNIYNQRRELQQQKNELEQQKNELQQQRNVLQNQSKELLELNATKDKFFSIIAHDLRSPFNGFLGLTQIMAEELPSLTMKELQEIAVDMRISATNLFRLLENLLHWSSMQQGKIPFKPEVTKLIKVVDESVTMIRESAKNKSIDIIIDIPNDTTVFADSNMLQTVIRNLFSNAVKFTHKGGKITISAKAKDGKNIEIAVKDSGIGMSPSLIENLFRLDVKTNRIGTEDEPSSGLGLLLCKDFIEKHDGKLLVESEEDKGSTFYFTMPYFTEKCEIKSEDNVVSNEVTENKINIESVKLKILIAEDDNTSANILGKFVHNFGNDIIKVRTGAAAVEACRNNPDIDLVLMDIAMPVMDGYEATSRIRDFNRKVVIIAQTANTITDGRGKAIAAGCNDYIAKPFTHTTLMALIKSIFK